MRGRPDGLQIGFIDILQPIGRPARPLVNISDRLVSSPSAVLIARHQDELEPETEEGAEPTDASLRCPGASRHTSFHYPVGRSELPTACEAHPFAKAFRGQFRSSRGSLFLRCDREPMWHLDSLDRLSDWLPILCLGLEWVLLFEIVSHTHRWLRPRTIPVCALAVFVLSRPLWLGIAIILGPVVGVDDPRRNEMMALFWDPAQWLPDLTTFPQNLGLMGSAVAVVLISYFFLHVAPTPPSTGERTLTAWNGCKGGNMSAAKSQTTRLLCASAFLAGAQFREQLLGYLEHESRGASPELGVDMRLVATVCQYARNRARLFDLYLFCALLVGLLAATISWLLGLVILALSATVVHFKMTYSERAHLAPNFCRETFDAAKLTELFPAQLEANVASALPHEDQNLIVYTGFSPFVGAGISLGGWSFVVDILKPGSTIESSGAPVPFKVEELYTDIRSGLSASNLEGLAIKDYYFVNGQEIRSNRDILPDIYGRPVQSLNGANTQNYRSRSDTRIRHYMWIRIHDWDQELVTSYFLRFSIRGRSLFVEINRFLLTPLSATYRRVDTLTPLRALDNIGMLIASAFAGPVHALLTPFFLLGRLGDAIEKRLGRKEKARRKNLDRDLLFDYGTGQGYRQALSSSRFEHFFQKADGDFFTKALESIILERTIAFLDEHHVDTSGLRERQNMILNSGIIVHGGDVKAESLAVGSGSQAIRAHIFQTKATGEAT